MKPIFFLSILLSLAQLSFSQDCYQDFIQKGKAAYDVLDFETAINQFKAAKICDDLPANNEADDWIDKAQNGFIDAIKKERTKAQSLALTAKSILELEKNNDATKAFRYAQYALQLDDNPDSRAAFYENFYQLERYGDRRNFYVRDVKVYEGFSDGVRTAGMIDAGKSIFISYEVKPNVDLYDFDGRKIGTIPSETYWYTDQAYCEKTGLLLGSGKEEKQHYVYGYQLKNKQLSKTPLFKYKVPEGDVEAVAISNDGTKIAVCLAKGVVHILNDKGTFLYELEKEKNSAKYLHFSNDNYLALGYGRLIKVLKLNDTNYDLIMEKELKGFYDPFLTLSPDHSKVMIAYSRKSLILNMDGDTIRSEDRDFARHVDVGNFSPKSEFVTFGNTVYDLGSQKVIRTFPEEVRNMKFAPDRSFIVLNMGGKMAALWKARGYQYTNQGVLGGHKGFILQTNFSPDSTHLITLAHDQSFKIWNPKIKAANMSWRAARLQQAFVIDGKLAIAQSVKNKLYIVNAAAEEEQMLNFPVKNIVSISDDGRYLFANNDSGNGIEVWRLDLANKASDFEYGITGIDTARIASFSSNDKAAFYSDNGSSYSLRVWDFIDGKTYYLSGYRGGIKALKWSPDNKRIAALDRYGELYIWNVEKGSDKAILEKQWIPHPEVSCGNLTFSNDGQQIVTCGWDNMAIIWDLKGNLQTRLLGHNFEINDADYSPDGKYIVTASEDNSAKVWTTDGALIASLERDYSDVKKVKFSDDGRYIITNYLDNAIKIWPFDPLLITEYLESFDLPDLSAEEKEKYGIMSIR